MTQDFERRLERIEKKLDEKIVYRDVYQAERDAIRAEIAHVTAAATKETEAAKNLINEKIENVELRVGGLETGRKVVVGLMATFLTTLIGGIILLLLQSPAT